MKRLLLVMSLLALSIQSFAQDIYISSWVELTEIVLKPNDCIIKGEFDDIESFTMPKEVEPQEKVVPRQKTTHTHAARCKRGTLIQESTKEQYPQSTENSSTSTPLLDEAEHSKQADQWDKHIANNEPSYKPVTTVTPVNTQVSEQSSKEKLAYYSIDEKKKMASGDRYYIEEDSWWKTTDRTREARYLVLVPANQRNAFWRTVTVIKPKVFWGGYKYAGTFFTYETVEEYRFSNPLKIGALLSLVGAGLYAYYKTL